MEKENRHGHSNSKMSYWGKGYETMNEFYDKNENKLSKNIRNIIQIAVVLLGII